LIMVSAWRPVAQVAVRAPSGFNTVSNKRLFRAIPVRPKETGICRLQIQCEDWAIGVREWKVKVLLRR
jgi:hypothetical protein